MAGVTKVAFFGEDSLLARGIADVLDTSKYLLLNSYKQFMPNSSRSFMTDHAWIPEIDATDTWEVDKVVEAVDLVINCTGLVNTDKCKNQVYQAYRSNILTAKTIARSCENLGVNLVHLATTASYGSGIISEKTSPVMFQTVYSGTKLVGESIVQETCEDVKIIRPCFIYGGKRDESSVIKKLIQRSLTNNHPFWNITLSLDNMKDLLWVEDFSEAVKVIIEKGNEGEVYNVSGEQGKTYRSIINLLEEAGIEIKNVIWDEDADYLGNHLVKNFKLRKLGWKPKVSLEEGIQKVINEIKNTDL